MDVLLAPHNDDEVLFACFTLITEKPHVIVCLTDPALAERREMETAAALQHLGLRSWAQWGFSSSDPPWGLVTAAIHALADGYDRVYAPEPRWDRNSHEPPGPPPRGFGVLQHDMIGQAALDAFGRDRFTGYLTYTRYGGKDTDGEEVQAGPGMVGMKLQALALYRSQCDNPVTRPHFLGRLDEYVAVPVVDPLAADAES